MLIFWNMAGVPLSYCHCTVFLANHDPSEYAWPKPFLIFLYASYLFMYWAWDTSNSQKNHFRAQEKGYDQERKTFPQLPWRAIPNAQHIKTDTGDSILVDGWFKYVRKMHYTCDMYFALCWALITGFSSPWPWFYPVFFAAMIVHRAMRDIERCREKYGEHWKEYERRVPYLFIPVSSIFSFLFLLLGKPPSPTCFPAAYADILSFRSSSSEQQSSKFDTLVQIERENLDDANGKKGDGQVWRGRRGRGRRGET
jgi:delta24(24(1))-sterol reductase